MKVLIVDDSQEISSIVKMILEDEGFEIRSATDGEEGLRIFVEFQPDLIITDIQMPGENGIEFVRNIRRLNPLVRTIYMSADFCSFRMPLEEEKEKYSAGLLEKPFSKDELMGLVSKITL